MPPLSTVRESTEAAIWERVIHPAGKMTVPAARHIVQLGFSDEEKERMHILTVKNQMGELTAEEGAELDNYGRVGSMLSILQSRARKMLKSRRRVS